MKTPYTVTEHGDLVENATISPHGDYGLGTVVYPYATIEEHCIIGHHCVVGSNVFVGSRSNIGAGTRIQHGAFICRGSKIGENVFIGPLACLIDDKYPVVGNILYKAEPPILENGCSIGAGAIVMPGVRVGAGAMVGAGAVVTKDVPSNVRIVGVPARVHPLEGPTVPVVVKTGKVIDSRTGFKSVPREGFGID